MQASENSNISKAKCPDRSGVSHWAQGRRGLYVANGDGYIARTCDENWGLVARDGVGLCSYSKIRQSNTDAVKSDRMSGFESSKHCTQYRL